ncbi:hypothetical protein CMV_023367 [Castanea mollissima]|uniref:Uncharacterized protein n=1 Tax=Castanea mollissima TaxID=60419 RepID=A0A8J4VJH0_9ROSI|nr:hypothetical protein CMV_023367 [Castanea mollissima]
MASSDKSPNPMPSFGDHRPPGEPMTMGQHMIDKGAQILQWRPITSSLASTRISYSALFKILTTPKAVSLVWNILYQISFLKLCLRRSKSCGTLMLMRSSQASGSIPEFDPGVIERPELENLAKTYGKFWCTWQVDRGK